MEPTANLLNRRSALLGAAGISCAALVGLHGSPTRANEGKQPTEFQIACMTLPYSQFPLSRALSGIKSAGYEFVAWGTSHRETTGGERIPVMPADAPPERARELAKQCRDLGLEPLMMFSTIYPEAAKDVEVLTQRIKRASAAGIPQVLTFGRIEGGNRQLWFQR